MAFQIAPMSKLQRYNSRPAVINTIENYNFSEVKSTLNILGIEYR